MPSPYQGSVDLPIQTFGGRVTQYDPQTLPIGASPFNQDVAYSGVSPDGVGSVAGVFTRPGMKAFYANPFAGNPTVNYLKTFVDSQAIYHLLSLDGLGNMWDESPTPVPAGPPPSLIGTVMAGALAQSDSLLNREWIAYSNSTYPGFGSDLPRQWDGVDFDRVSQCAAGTEFMTVADGDQLPGLAIAASPNGLKITSFQIFGISQDATTGVVTLITDVGFYSLQNILQIGDTINVTGVVTVTAYNGTWTVTSVGPGFVQFFIAATGQASDHTGNCTFNIGTIQFAVIPDQDHINLFTPGLSAKITGAGNALWNGSWVIRGFSLTNSPYGVYVVLNSATLANSGGGLAQPPSSITAGLRGVSVCYLTDEQYITKPGPPIYWTAAGGLLAHITNAPIGPSNVIARIFIFTPTIVLPATSGPFFYLDGPTVVNPALTFPSMVVMDNTTTTLDFNFLDAVLENGTPATNLYNLIELGEVSTFCAYSGRLFACGELNSMEQFLDMEFNAGWALGAGIGGSDIPLGWTSVPVYGTGGTRVPNGGVWLDAYQILCAGLGAFNGMISQSAYQDFLGVPILAPNTNYSARVTAKSSTAGAVTIHLELFSPTLGSLGVELLQTGVNYSTQIVPNLGPTPAAIPPDLVFRVYATGPAGQTVTIDRLEIFPTNQPYNNTQIRGSYALDPESFDGSTGVIDVGPNNGYPAKALFNLLDGKLYIVTELGMYSTQDDGANEPDLWPTPSVSATVGTRSPRGVGVGESWAIIAHKTGAFIFWGGEPVKISQEIQPDWDTINWNYGQTIYVVVDTNNKRIHIGAPVNGSTVPNVEFVCDYSQLANAEGSVSGQDIAAHPQAYYSVYNPTKVVAPGKARKWTLWNLSMNCAAQTIRSDGSYHLLRGNATGTGKIYDQVPTQLSDDGVAIDSQYQTAYFPGIEDEQMLQLGSHRKTYIYLTGYATGAGPMNWTYYGAQNQRAVQLSFLNLTDPYKRGDFEMNTNFVAERASLLFGTNAVGSWFKLTKLCPSLQRDPMTPVRGVT